MNEKNERMDDDNDGGVIRYIITGRAAHARVGRLLRGLLGGSVPPADYGDDGGIIRRPSSSAAAGGVSWVDLSPHAADADADAASANPTDDRIDFLWENAPRSETRKSRDFARCYSHLPFGMLLDDKWALARLVGSGRGGEGGGCRGAASSSAAAAATTASAAAANDDDNRAAAAAAAAAGGGNCGLRRGGGGGGGGGGGSAAEGGSIPILQGRTGIGKGAESSEVNRYLATLESHCFRGSDGFAVFAGRVGLLPPNDAAAHGSCEDRRACGADNDRYLPHCRFEDLLSRSSSSSTTTTTTTPPMPSNLWVIKDANSNGAGGIWIVDERNARDFVPPNRGDRGVQDDAGTPTIPRTPPMPTPPLNPNHRYVAQRYAWPPTLYSGRKCHVRAYALLTCDGRAYLHRRAFLHVANEPFAYDNDAAATAANGGEGGAARATRKNTEGETAAAFDPSVHITNCCANSHDATKFTGEICVDLERMPPPRPRCRDPRGIHSRSHLDNDGSDDENDKVSADTSFMDNDCNRCDEFSSSHSTSKSPPLPLGEYLPSISASVASLASSFGPYLGGGEANCGFEYLGLDFVLSSVEVEGEGDERYGDNDNDGGDHGGIGWRDGSNGDGSKSSSTERRSCRRLPVAYLLEANAPPSQDTATGLMHAEALHDEVVTDLLRMWVLPNVVGDPSQSTRNDDAGDDVFSRSHSRRDCGGWRCVYFPPESTTAASDIDSRERCPILPSKAAILNRIRWALFEHRASKQYEMLWNKIDDNEDESDNQQSTGASTLSTSLSALLPGGGGLNTQEDGKDVTLADQFCELSSSGEKEVVSFSFSHHHTDEFVSFVRSQFPYYSTDTAANYVDDTTRINSSSSNSATTARITNAIFFESGGGAQVPQLVTNAVASSLGCRDRSVIGRNIEREARLALSSLLVNKINYSAEPCKDDDDNLEDDGSHVVIMGSNASSLLDLLARRMYESGILYQGDEIVISTENHLANVTPWLDLAAKIVGGVKVKWWTVVGPTATNETSKKNDHRTKDQNYCAAESSSCILSDLITDRTRIVAISHVSNVLGMERDVPAICDLVHRITKGRGHVVVDGVAAAPHLLSSKAINATKIGGRGTPDWYIVSLHKLFGPHLGCLIGRRSTVVQMTTRAVNVTVRTEGKGVETDAAASFLSNEILAKSWERGTMNYEACSGAIALLKYAEKIGMKAYESFDTTRSSRQTSNQVTSESSDVPISSSFYVNIASACVQYVEDRLVCRLLGYLQSCTPLVRIIQDVGDMKVSKDPYGNGSINLRRVPTVCFLHASISSHTIVEHCRRHGVVCRACKFLSTDRLWDELLLGEDVNVVRFSLAHYNTPEEIDASVRILETLEGWL